MGGKNRSFENKFEVGIKISVNNSSTAASGGPLIVELRNQF